MCLHWEGQLNDVTGLPFPADNRIALFQAPGDINCFSIHADLCRLTPGWDTQRNAEIPGVFRINLQRHLAFPWITALLADGYFRPANCEVRFAADIQVRIESVTMCCVDILVQ
ncbi:hypothetical protein D3C80_1314910 [compost metagenome]